MSSLLHADRTLTGRLRDVEMITRIVPSGSMWFPIRLRVFSGGQLAELSP